MLFNENSAIMKQPIIDRVKCRLISFPLPVNSYDSKQWIARLLRVIACYRMIGTIEFAKVC